MTEQGLNRTWLRVALLVVFLMSGFAGLIYESVWSRYLKLFLGHAAHSQTLVLAIFMGGMAVGAWFTATRSVRWRNLLRWYAVTEGVIGVCGLAFHSLFVSLTEAAYTTLMPAVGHPMAVTVLKWTLSGLLILPPSILLGMTFPLMTAGMIRLFPGLPGSTIALLYFLNSLGAAIGVLVSGFVLVGAVGLPGTLLAAGVVNILLAIIVWFLLKPVEEEAVQEPSLPLELPSVRDGRYVLLLWVALLTGLASFVYEIGWIRMLSLVLGTATHAFELMLSAFIAGLAFGGLWIKRRIDRVVDPMSYLGWIQVTMGLLALSTLVVYGSSFEVMEALMEALAESDQGYVLFNLASHAFALAVMFPTTFCAGMTLPLITYTLLRRGGGEASIGSVYAANTLGAIVGVILAVHVGMPLLGLKHVIMLGATIDMALGGVLLWSALRLRKPAVPAGAMGVCAGAVLLVLLGVHLDPLKMASGVYRKGSLLSSSEATTVFHRDGTTATIDLVSFKSGFLSFRTNGKADASLNVRDETKPTRDELTMVLVGAIPMAVNPEAEAAAVIGMGSGLTTHFLLANRNLKRVDTIEIEAAAVEAARGFGRRVARVFDDPRSRIFLDDAKAFFSTHDTRYDLVVSEPSNPWVSGVSSLFSEEFYRLVDRHLTENGVLAQWVQAYEISPVLVASIVNALSTTFRHYAIFAASDWDMLVLASNGQTEFQLKPDLFRQPAVAEELRRHRITAPAHLDAHRVGDHRLLQPLFASFGAPANSDYFPFLDLRAVRSRFLQEDAKPLLRLRNAPIPVAEMLSHAATGAGGDADRRTDAGSATPTGHYQKSMAVHRAALIKSYFLRGRWASTTLVIPTSMQKDLELLNVRLLECHNRRGTTLWFHSLFRVASAMNAHLTPGDAGQVWRKFTSSPCYDSLDPSSKQWLSLFEAVGSRNARQMAHLAEALLARGDGRSAERFRYLVAAAMTGHLAQGHRERAAEVWARHHRQLRLKDPKDLSFRLLLSHLVTTPSVWEILPPR